MMQAILGAYTLMILPALVLVRSAILRTRGVSAIKFGKIDKTDFLIPLVAWPYFYVVFANAFGWKMFAGGAVVTTDALAWLGVLACVVAIALMVASLIAFGSSFRVGIDDEHPDKLVTGGVFAISRNPIYVAFAFVLLGELLIFPNWLLALYLIGAYALFHRQVLREEAFLREHCGDEYTAYAARVRRYL